MEPISNTDRLVMLLRQKLQERARTVAGRAVGKEKSGDAPEAVSGLQAMAAIEGADEGLLRRALIQNILADQFGPELINDAQFQQIVSRVDGAIESDADMSRLLSRVLSDLRSP